MYLVVSKSFDTSAHVLVSVMIQGVFLSNLHETRPKDVVSIITLVCLYIT